MQTKQLFDCRPVSVALVVHIFFFAPRCRHRVVDHGRHLVCLQIVLSHRCKSKACNSLTLRTSQIKQFAPVSAAFSHSFIVFAFCNTQEVRTRCVHTRTQLIVYWFWWLHHRLSAIKVHMRNRGNTAPQNNCSSVNVHVRYGRSRMLVARLLFSVR